MNVVEAPQGVTTPTITAPKPPKPKDPKKVAAGKRLAEISKQAKAKKKAERESAEGFGALPPMRLMMPEQLLLIALSGLALTAVGTYYGYRTYVNAANAKANKPTHLDESARLVPPVPKRPSLDSLH